MVSSTGRVILGSLLALTVAACGGTAAPAQPSNSPAQQSSAAAKPASAAAAPASAAASKPAAKPETSAAAPASATAGALKVKWAVSGLAPEAGIYVAKDRGYFQQEGLDVDLQIFRAFTDELPLLATGQLDYGTGGLNPDIFNASNRDIPVKIVTANAVGTPGDASAALLVRQDLIDSGRYKELKDLKGMKLAENSLGTSSQLITERILAKGGLSKNDIEFVTVPFSEMSTALANKGIDAAFTVEPFVNAIVNRKLAKSIMTGAEGFPGAVNQVVIISPIFAKQQPEPAKKLMAAFLKGQREYLAAFISNTNPSGRDDIIQILTKYTALKDPKQYVGMGMSGGDPNGSVDVKVLGEFQDYFLKAGTQKEPVDMNKVVDTTYTDYAVQRLGKA